MKQALQDLIQQALTAAMAAGDLPNMDLPMPQIDRTKDKSHGDFASNIAMMLAKPAKMNPRQIAEILVAAISDAPMIEKIEIAGPGFINFTLTADTAQQVISTVLSQGDAYGRSQIGAEKTANVEFVSANPTGPLHVGHGRGAAYGSVVSSLLSAVGYQVHREYYVNDAGRQMEILATSVWLRYLEACGEEFTFPSNGYKGAYVLDIAAALKENVGTDFQRSALDAFAEITPDETPDGNNGGDKEKHIDDLTRNAKALLGAERYRQVFDLGLSSILADIKADLAEFGTEYEAWFSEHSLMENGAVEAEIERLKAADVLYEKEGAWWFRSSDYGDEKDRVVVRDNGQTTYFASDIAYHLHKFHKNPDLVIDVWGSDHHGYIPRVKAGLTASGLEGDKLTVLLVQFAVLYRGGEKVAMSTRSGEFVMLRDLVKEIGRDAARFFYVMRGADQHMDFDLDLAKSQSNDNPVYYVQYAHARVCSVFRQLAERGLAWDQAAGEANVGLLTEDHEQALMTALARYPEVVATAARLYTPHALTNYLVDLARDFHSYYNAHYVIIDDVALRQARLALIRAVQHVIVNGLGIIGVSAPETM